MNASGKKRKRTQRIDVELDRSNCNKYQLDIGLLFLSDWRFFFFLCLIFCVLSNFIVMIEPVFFKLVVHHFHCNVLEFFGCFFRTKEDKKQCFDCILCVWHDSIEDHHVLKLYTMYKYTQRKTYWARHFNIGFEQDIL